SIENPGGANAMGATGGSTTASGGSSGASGKAAGGTGNSVGNGGSSGNSGTSGNGGSSGAVVSPPMPQVVSMQGQPIYSRFLRLTNSQWENSVHDILKLTAATGVSDNFQHA